MRSFLRLPLVPASDGAGLVRQPPEAAHLLHHGRHGQRELQLLQDSGQLLLRDSQVVSSVRLLSLGRLFRTLILSALCVRNPRLWSTFSSDS